MDSLGTKISSSQTQAADASQSSRPQDSVPAYHDATVIHMTSRWKISSIAAWGENRLFVGGNDGSLRIFETDSDRVTFKETRKEEKFAKKSISQMVVVFHEQKDFLIALCDEVVTIYRLPSLERTDSVTATQGSYLFVCDRGENVPLGDEDDSKRALREQKSRSQALRLCSAMKGRLLFFSWELGRDSFAKQSEETFLERAVCLRWAGDNIIVGDKKMYHLVRFASGPVTQLWPVGKKALHAVSALLPHGEVLLAKNFTGICVDYNGKPTRGEQGLVWSEPITDLIYHHPYVIVLFPNSIEIRNFYTRRLVQTVFMKSPYIVSSRGHSCVYVASEKNLRCLHVIPLSQVVQNLIRREQFEEAMAVVSSSRSFDWPQSNKKTETNKVHILYAYHAFNCGDYEKAMMRFQQTDIDARQIVALFPDVVPRRGDYISTVAHPITVKRLSEGDRVRALSQLIPFLGRIRGRLQVSRVASKKTEEAGKELELEPLEQLRQRLRDRSTQKPSTQFTDEAPISLASLVDTALLKAYLLTDPNVLVPWLQQPNDCDVDETELSLRQHERFRELVCFYKHRQYHDKALQLLQDLGQSSNVSNPLFGTAPTVEYLQYMIARPELIAMPEVLDLILEFSHWVINQNVDDGLAIFTHTLPPAGIPGRIVLNHLKSISDSRERTYECCILYLEALIKNGETDPELHNELVFLYLGEVTKLAQKSEGKQALKGETAGPLSLSAESVPGKLGRMRRKLLSFLQSKPQYYQAEHMLTKFPANELLEEKAILLSRVQKHAEALTIYAHKLHQHEKAEQYCEEHADAGSDKNLFLTLLEVYLFPDRELNAEPLPEPAFQLLAKYPDRIPSSEALRILPETTSIRKLMPYFTAVLADARHRRRHSQVIKHLLKAEYLQVKVKKLEGQQPRIAIRESTLCPVCNKKIGNSAFARYPDGRIVHYICQRKKEDERNGWKQIPCLVFVSDSFEIPCYLMDATPKLPSIRIRTLSFIREDIQGSNLNYSCQT
eukprot:g72584.t1